MSKIMQYVRIRDADLERLKKMLVEDPDGAYEYTDELADGDDEDDTDRPERRRGVDIDKAWDALRFLLDRAGPPPVDAITGGIALTTDEWGLEPPRYLTPDEVTTAAEHFEATPFSRLAEHYDPEAMAEVYPHGWDDGRRAYLRGWYETLTRFFHHAAIERDGMILYLI